MMKIGDVGIPKDFEILSGVIIEIREDLTGEPLYILDNGCKYTDSELEDPGIVIFEEVPLQDMEVKKIIKD